MPAGGDPPSFWVPAAHCAPDWLTATIIVVDDLATFFAYMIVGAAPWVYRQTMSLPPVMERHLNLYALFIAFCGFSHLCEVASMYAREFYYVECAAKTVAAAISVYAAAFVISSPAQLMLSTKREAGDGE